MLPVGRAEAGLAATQITLQRAAVDERTVAAATFLVALPVVSRFEKPADALVRHFGIAWQGDPMSTLASIVDERHAAAVAACQASERIMSSARFRQCSLDPDEWTSWRFFDGGGFCEIAGNFFSALLKTVSIESLGQVNPSEDEALALLSDELTRITWAFTARWFHRCVAGQIPDHGSVGWFLGHSIGKIGLELEREHAVLKGVEYVASPRIRPFQQASLFES